MVQRPSAMVVQSNGVSRIERTLGGKDSFNETGDLFISHIYRTRSANNCLQKRDADSE
jgi:hypothetical protein